MSLRIRRGTDAQRQTALLDQGELAYTTDTQKLFIGDGATSGGVNVLATAAGTGLIFDQVTQTLKVSGSNTVVEADTAPSLGGNLNLNSHNITGTGNINIAGSVTSGSVLATTTVTTPVTATTTSGSQPAIIATSSFTPALTAYSGVNPSINLFGITDGFHNTARMEVSASRGTILAPTNTIAGDGLGGIYVKGLRSNTYVTAGGFGVAWSSSANFSNAAPGAISLIFAGNNAGSITQASLNGITGVFNAPVFQTTVYSVAGVALPSASSVGNGARAFVSDAMSNTFANTYTGGGAFNVPVYSDGTTWYIG